MVRVAASGRQRWPLRGRSLFLGRPSKPSQANSLRRSVKATPFGWPTASLDRPTLGAGVSLGRGCRGMRGKDKSLHAYRDTPAGAVLSPYLSRTAGRPSAVAIGRYLDPAAFVRS